MRWPCLQPRVAQREEFPLRPPEFPALVGYRGLDEADPEVFRGPDHGPMPAPAWVQESYLQPLKPKLGDDGKLHYVPADTADEP